MDHVPLPPLPPQPHKDFIETLQSLSEPMKRRVLVAASAVMMLVVVYVWVGYFNNIVMGNPAAQLADQNAVAEPAPATAQAPAAPAVAQPVAPQSPLASAPGFWSELGGGLAWMYHGAVNDFKGAGSALQSPEQYDITPTQPAQATP